MLSEKSAVPEDALSDAQVRRQKDLKVVVMSATLDAVKFADFFRAGKIVHVMVQPSSNSLSTQPDIVKEPNHATHNCHVYRAESCT